MPSPVFEEVAQGFRVTIYGTASGVVDNVVDNNSKREMQILSLIRKDNRLSASAIGKMLHV